MRSDLEIDDSAIDAAAEQFRYQHDLITAEETERWLEERGLDLGDFSAYFVRHYWAETANETAGDAIDYLSASAELRALLTIELILFGELERMAGRSSWRIAARQAEGGDKVDPASSRGRGNAFSTNGPAWRKSRLRNG